MKYLFTGGGTGGHLYPALAVARELAADPANELLYVGIRGRAEEQVLGGERRDPRLPLVFAVSAGFPGLRSVRLPAFLLKLGLGCLQAAGHLLRFRPDLVFATGGYASAPAVFAAYGLRRLKLLNTRILIHEQNVQPGLMNRKAAGLADLVALTFAASASHVPRERTVLAGYPVRRDLLDRPDGEEACRGYGLDPDKPVLLVFGGSQGARCINRTVYALLPRLLAAGIQVVHGYGVSRGAYDAGRQHDQAVAALHEDPNVARLMDQAYRPFDYLHDIRTAYAAADLVLARAGAGAIFELVTCRVPAILVPKMGLPMDHQVANARLMELTGAARVVLERPLAVPGGFEEEVDEPALFDLIRNLIVDDDALAQMARKCEPLSMAQALEKFVMLSKKMAAGGEVTVEPIAVSEAADELARLEMADDDQLLGLARRGGLTDKVRHYLVYRYGAALASESWQRRNRGIKLAGALKDPGAVPLLLHIARDRRKPGLLARLLGEKRYQNGFIRRNVAVALGQIGVAGDEVISTLADMLGDSYWEVRVEATRALARLHPDRHSAELVARIEGKLKSRSFEEVQAAIHYWNLRGVAGNWREAILPLLNHNNIRVREKAVAALIHQVKARRLPGGELTPILRDVLVTSTWFSPEFPLKTHLRELARAIEDAGRPADKGAGS
jgi:UDP-N-acetylglucosamine--N-acetylmuramyl-(pentapeptide) pyrophosphoryl-undecaprenol N-acetylglucosamine transferase